MSKSCALYPRLNNGEISPLFTRLKEYFGNRENALYWYQRAKSPDFLSTFSDVKTDNNGEPLFEDLISKCNLDEALDETNTLKRLNKEFSQTLPRNYTNLKTLQTKAVTFNNSNILRDKFFATIESNKGDITISIKPTRELKKNDKNRLAINVGINTRLEELLNSWGVEIGALTSLEEELGMKGVTDFDVATIAANGIKQVIRLAKGNKGQEVLPEEFAHFAIAAIGNIPLKTRLVNTLKNRDVLEKILGESYEDYRNLYNDNIDLLAEEALGKIAALVLNDQSIYTPNKNLLDRFIASIKNFFRNHEENEIDNIINDVLKEVYELTGNIVNNRYSLNTASIDYKGKMASLGERISRDTELVKRTIEQEAKRLKIYGQKEEFSTRQKNVIASLQRSLEEKKELEGIYEYCQNSFNVLNTVSKRLENIGNLDTKDKFKLLRNIRNYIASYGTILDEIRNSIYDSSREGDDRLKDKLKVVVDNNLDLIGRLSRDYYTVAKDEFTKFIEPFVGEVMANTLNQSNFKRTTAKELIESMDKDITLLDRWLDSMGDSSDLILQFYDKEVKKQKGLSRLDTIKTEKEILARTRKLEQSGVKNTAFMYERDRDGKITGNYIQKTWWAEYNRAKHEYFERLKQKYGDKQTDLDSRKYNYESWLWYRDNTTTDEYGMRVPTSKWDNPEYKKLNKDQKEYHDFIMGIKTKHDNFLPKANTNLAPQVRRDFLERALSNDNKAKYFWETIKDQFVRREDDLDMESKDVILDFSGNEFNRLPIYYTRRLEDMNDLSLDAASSLIAYVAMANDYNRMNEVIDILETGRMILASREVVQNSGGIPKIEKFKEFGIEVKKLLTKKGDSTYFIGKLNDFMNVQVYNKLIKDEGTLLGTKIENSKLAAFINKLTSWSTVALSPLTGLASLGQNLAMTHIESASKQFFSTKDLLVADKEYFKYLPEFIGQFGTRIKTSKLALFNEMFNVSQDYRQHVRGVDFDKKNIFAKMINRNALYFTTRMPDHYSQHRIAIALSNRVPIFLNGKKTTLWEALEVTPIDKNNPSLGATLQLKEGATKADGTKWTDQDTLRLSNQIRAVENRLYGIYNEEDRVALKQYIWGRMAMVYRDWMRPLYMNRFGKGKYNTDLGMYTEGHYQTLYRFIKTLYGDLRQTEFHIATHWRELSPYEKGNLKKAFTETVSYWTLVLLVNLLQDMGDDDDKSWSLRLAEYTAARLKTDIGAMLPGPTVIDEATKLFDSPFAALTTIRKIRNLLNVLDPTSYMEVIESGKYKGYTEAEKVVIDVLPFRDQIIDAFDPSQPAKWYK